MRATTRRWILWLIAVLLVTLSSTLALVWLEQKEWAPLGGLVLLNAIRTLGTLFSILVAIRCWFLIPKRIRMFFWRGADLLILLAFVVATVTLPLQPPSTKPLALLGPVVRLSITVVFSFRLLLRLLAPLLDSIERLNLRLLAAARYLRSKKSGFLTIIGVLAILAVTVSSCALTTTLSVMGGFRQDLKRKILGNHAHVVVDRQDETFEGWKPILSRVRSVPDVVAATPFVSGEVMTSSVSNRVGAVLRGIDTKSIGQVTELVRNLRAGKLVYLEKPELLLKLPPEEVRGVQLPMTTGSWRARGEKKRKTESVKVTGSAVRDVQKIAEKKPALPKGTASDDLLLPYPVEAPRDVLPGVIVGQELARSLRLFVGDEINIVAPLGALGPSGPIPKARPFRVAGIFYSGMYEYDMKYVYAALPTVQEFLGVGDAITGIEVKLGNLDRAPEVASAIRRTLSRSPKIRVRDWQEMNKSLFGALALEKLAMFIALGIAVLVASFSVIGMLILMVEEKGREVAILKAMGADDRTIIGIFMAVGALVGMFGASMGLLFGYTMCFVAEHFGVKLNPEVYYIDRLPVYVDPMEFTVVFVAAVFLCVLVTIYPAVLASRLRPVDALRYQ